MSRRAWVKPNLGKCPPWGISVERRHGLGPEAVELPVVKLVDAPGFVARSDHVKTPPLVRPRYRPRALSHCNPMAYILRRCLPAAVGDLVSRHSTSTDRKAVIVGPLGDLDAGGCGDVLGDVTEHPTPERHRFRDDGGLAEEFLEVPCRTNRM